MIGRSWRTPSTTQVDPLVEEGDASVTSDARPERMPVAPREVPARRRPTSTTPHPCTRSRCGDRSVGAARCARPRARGSTARGAAARTAGTARCSARTVPASLDVYVPASRAGCRRGGTDRAGGRRCARPPRTRRRTRRSRGARSRARSGSAEAERRRPRRSVGERAHGQGLAIGGAAPRTGCSGRRPSASPRGAPIAAYAGSAARPQPAAAATSRAGDVARPAPW